MEKWENALSLFCGMCKDNNIDFYLIGSISACVRGVDILPSDIDVVVDIHDLPKVHTVFGQYIIEPVDECGFEAVRYFGKISLGDVVMEIYLQPQNRYGRHPIETLCWNGHIIKAQSLDLLYKVYKKNHRTEYINAIEQFLTLYSDV